MMKKYIITLVLIFIISNIYCGEKFEVNTVIVKTKGTAVSATHYNGDFYYLNNQRKIFKINGLTNEHEEIATSDISFEYILNVDGKLIGHETLFKPYKYNTFTEYHFDGTKFNKSGRVKEEARELYSDDFFDVSGSCSGEWGGTVYFRDKRTKNTYECAATCPLSINKINDTYIVTATLEHLSGSTEIIQINDPTKLKLSDKIGKKESESKQGASLIIDSVGVMAITSFVCNNELYHIVTKDYGHSGERSGTYLTKVKNGKLETIKRISNSFLGRNDFCSEIPYNKGKILPLRVSDTNEVLLLAHEGNKITIFLFK